MRQSNLNLCKVEKIISRACFQEENLYKSIRNTLDYKFLRNMPNFRSVHLLICLTLQATLSAELVLIIFDSALVQSPLRINELEGDRIVELSKLPFSTPLIYPKAVSVFERFDASLPKFCTLEELASNPVLCHIMFSLQLSSC